MKPLTVGDVVAVFVKRRFVAALVKAIHDDYLIVSFTNNGESLIISREAVARREWTTK